MHVRNRGVHRIKRAVLQTHWRRRHQPPAEPSAERDHGTEERDQTPVTLATALRNGLWSRSPYTWSAPLMARTAAAKITEDLQEKV